MNYCKDCKFFDEQKFVDSNRLFGMCNKLKMDYVKGEMMQDSCNMKNWDGKCKDFKPKEKK